MYISLEAVCFEEGPVPKIQPGGYGCGGRSAKASIYLYEVGVPLGIAQ
jgi:hypothetical protein